MKLKKWAVTLVDLYTYEPKTRAFFTRKGASKFLDYKVDSSKYLTVKLEKLR